MPIDEERTLECFSLFGLIVPLGKKGSTERITLEALFGEKMERIVPDLIDAIRQMCMLYPEKFDSYLEFIKESIQYMRRETDKLPEVDWNVEELKKYLDNRKTIFNIQVAKETQQMAAKEIKKH